MKFKKKVCVMFESVIYTYIGISINTEVFIKNIKPTHDSEFYALAHQLSCL